MKTKEAIERVTARFNKWALDEEDLAALQALGLVPMESEDEWIRKHIIKILDNLAPCHWDGNEKARCIAYLERQKEQKDYNKLYEDIANSEWFKRAYKGKSLGCDYEQKEQSPFISAEESLGISQEEYNKIVHECIFGEQKPAESSEEEVPNETKQGCGSIDVPRSIKTSRIEALKNLLSYFKCERKSTREEINTSFIPCLEYLLKDAENSNDRTEWSKEDQEMLEKCVSHMVNIIPVPGKHGLEDMSFEKHTDEELVLWLNLLPKRFNLQPKQDWNEEDERHKEAIIESIRLVMMECADSESIEKYEKDIDWLENRLKFFRPQHITYALDAPLGYDKDMNPIYPPINHWKPSEEQMGALEHFIRSWGESGTMSPQNPILCAAKSLYNKLIAEIERRLKIVEPHKDTFESAAACRQELIWMKDFITSLQQEQLEDIVAIAKTFLDALSKTPYNNKPITDAQIIVKQLLLFFESPKEYNPDAILDQSEVDLNAEIDNEWKKCEPIDEGMGLESANIVNEQFDSIARYFYELGLNARKK